MTTIGMPALRALSNEGWMPFGSSGQISSASNLRCTTESTATIWACGLYSPPTVVNFMPRLSALSLIPSFSALMIGFAITGGMNAIDFCCCDLADVLVAA
jgi:hypothetical protein